MRDAVAAHYDLLIDEGNDPVLDPPPLRAYMEKWDGQMFLDALALSGTQSVLEIGVGTGRLAVRAAPLCAAFTGIDLSPKTVARAREHLAACPNAMLVCGDFLTYAFTQSFDVIYSSLAFMHIADKQRAIEKAAELLTPGGRFVLSIDKNPAAFIDTGTRRIVIYPDTPDETAARIAAAGLTLFARPETEFAHIFVARK